MPNGQPTFSWSATAFSPVFGESAARIPAGLPHRTIFLLPTATEDRLGAELWRTRPAIPKIPFKTRNEPILFFLGQRNRILLAKALEQSYSAGQPYHGYYFKC